MKKVLNIVPYQYLPYFSGGQKLIAQFNHYLGEQCVLHVAGTVDNDDALVNTYSFHPILRKSRFRYADIGSFFRIKKLIKKEKIDTVIIEHPYLGWLGWLLKKTTRTKLVVHTHNIESERFRTLGKPWWKILQLYEMAVLRGADTVFCISDEDRQWMIDKMRITADKCILVPYGIANDVVPADKVASKQKVCATHKIDPAKKLLFFNGLLDYKPNTDALKAILKEINPRLQKTNLDYHILIAGKRLPDSFNELKEWNKEGITYAGFVDDIDLYTKAADILLNPVNSGGGVKTKMIEALGLNTSVVATETGATGVDLAYCGDKLKIIPDASWERFTEAIIYFANTPGIKTPPQFYSTYYWKEIIKKAVPFI